MKKKGWSALNVIYFSTAALLTSTTTAVAL